jgi:hypothetical protein
MALTWRGVFGPPGQAMMRGADAGAMESATPPLLLPCPPEAYTALRALGCAFGGDGAAFVCGTESLSVHHQRLPTASPMSWWGSHRSPACLPPRPLFRKWKRFLSVSGCYM